MSTAHLAFVIWLMVAAGLLYNVSLFPNHRWYRRMRGGRWSLWTAHTLLGGIWTRGWERPRGGGVIMLAEQWADGSLRNIRRPKQ